MAELHAPGHFCELLTITGIPWTKFVICKVECYCWLSMLLFSINEVVYEKM